MATALLLLGGLGGGGAGCTSGDARDVTVAWHLVDGRSCLDTAVAEVTVKIDGGTGTPVTSPCHALPTDNKLIVRGVAPGTKLLAQALSGREAVLYRGELRVPDPVPAQLELALYYTGGE